MGATILDDVIIGDHCLVGAHALITKGMNIPPRSLVLGSPGRVVRALSESEIAELDSSAISYMELASHYRKHFGG
jgi:carbonic anhydrase/acetyltransferase-like protein (isoleucine patch superfamily)